MTSQQLPETSAAGDADQQPEGSTPLVRAGSTQPANCLNCGQPAGFTTPTGHPVCDQCAITGPNLSDTLDEVSAFIARYMAFDTDHQLVAATLWAAHTYIAHRVTVTPYLHVTSAEPESGKSRLLEVLEQTVANPWRTVMPTPAVLYRKTDKSQDDGGVTLLLDEIDPIFTKKGADDTAEALRAVLNAGFQKGLTVERCQPPSMKLVAYNPYGPKALAGIGDVPDTIASRSIRIRLKRRKPSERVDPFFVDEAAPIAAEIRVRLSKKVVHVDLGYRREIRRELLQLGLGDRAADGWSILVAVADEAGGSWPKWARAAARELSGKQASESDGLGIRLLEDCRDVLDGWEHEHIFSKDLRGQAHRDRGCPLERLQGQRDLTTLDRVAARQIRRGFRHPSPRSCDSEGVCDPGLLRRLLSLSAP